MNMSEKQLQVLYVEDDQEMARSLALALKRYNISLTAAGSYHRAWQPVGKPGSAVCRRISGAPPAAARPFGGNLRVGGQHRRLCLF